MKAYLLNLAKALVLSLSLLSCSQVEPTPKGPYELTEIVDEPTTNLRDKCLSRFHPGFDYFPEKTHFKHSTQLSVSYHGHFKRVEFRSAVSSEEPTEIVLVQCGAPIPPHGPGAIVISVPVSRIATASRAMLGAADKLGIVEKFVGVSDPRAITVASFQERVRQGRISMMSGHAHGNIEPLMALDPDVYFTFHSAYPQFNVHPKLWALGIRAVPHADSLEATPLGRAEWMKLSALLTNTEAIGDAEFEKIESQYRFVSSLLQTSVQPKVLAGTASARDVMELFGGRNHRAQLLRDAGGKFVLNNDQFPGSWLITSFERVYAAGADAPFWIGTRPGIESIEALVAANPHHRWFGNAVHSRNVYATDQGYRGMFAYHLEDQGLNNPHIQLAEIASILHPELRPQLTQFSSPPFIRKLK